jgi:hypothetical protein
MSDYPSSELSLEETFIAERFCALMNKDTRRLAMGPPTQCRKTWTKTSRLAKAEDYLDYAAGLMQLHSFHLPPQDVKKYEGEHTRYMTLT